jgi:hypothetical protein
MHGMDIRIHVCSTSDAVRRRREILRSWESADLACSVRRASSSTTAARAGTANPGKQPERPLKGQYLHQSLSSCSDSVQIMCINQVVLDHRAHLAHNPQTGQHPVLQDSDVIHHTALPAQIGNVMRRHQPLTLHCALSLRPSPSRIKPSPLSHHNLQFMRHLSSSTASTTRWAVLPAR